MSSCCFVKLFRSGSIISSVEFARDRDRDRDRDDVDARSPPSGFDNDRRKLLVRSSNSLLLASSDSIVSSDLRCVLSSNNDLMEE